MGLAFLLINTLLLAVYLVLRRGEVLAFLLFFQQIHWLLFSELDLVEFRTPYFLIVFAGFLLALLASQLRYSKLSKGLLNFPTLSLLLFYLIMGYYLISGNVPTDRGGDIISSFLIQVTPLFVLIALLISNKKTIAEVANGILVFGLLYFLILVIMVDFASFAVEDRMAIRELYSINPIGISRVFGMVFIVAFLYLINTKKLYSIAGLSLQMTASGYILILGASRGPIIAVFISLLTYILLKSDNIGTLLKGLMVTVLVVLVSLFFASQYSFGILDRFYELSNYESMGRYTRFQMAAGILSNPDVWLFGLGTDGFDHLTDMNYPHNIIIEMLVEYGILGILSLLILLAYGAYCCNYLIKENTDTSLHFLPVIFIYLVFNAMVSGNIFANRMLWILAILMSTAIYTLKKDNAGK